MISGVPDYVDGLMLGVAEQAGGRIINADRMWHYPEGIQNHAPIWTGTESGSCPGPSPLWLDATAARLPPPLFPGFDALGALRHITMQRPRSLVVPAGREDDRHRVRALRIGTESRSDRQGHRRAAAPVRGGPTRPVQAFIDQGVDFIVADSLAELVTAMNSARWRRSHRRRRASRDHPGPRRAGAVGLGQGPADRRDRRRPPIPGRPADPHLRRPTNCSTAPAAPSSRSGARADPQDARRHRDGPVRPRAAAGWRGPPRRSTPPARSPDSAAGACTATARSRGRSSAVACSQAGSLGERPPLTSGDGWPAGTSSRYAYPWPQRRMMHMARRPAAASVSAAASPTPRRRRGRTATGGTSTPTITTPSTASSWARPISCGARSGCARPRRSCSVTSPAVGSSRSVPARRCALAGSSAAVPGRRPSTCRPACCATRGPAPRPRASRFRSSRPTRSICRSARTRSTRRSPPSARCRSSPTPRR